MSNEHKFLKTTDEPTADKLISFGFKLISKTGNIYTFLNNTPTHFSFDAIDAKKVVYDNILSL